MVVTVPLGRRARLSLRAGLRGPWMAVRWRGERTARCGDWWDGEDAGGSAGVREPRRPRPSAGGGAIALPMDGP